MTKWSRDWSSSIGNYAVRAHGEAAEKQLLKSTLEEVFRTPDGHYGETCWRLFDELGLDWSDDDFKSYEHQGGGFYSLPTAQYCEGGNILFISESQRASLDAGRVSFVLEHAPHEGDWRFWFERVEAFDVVVIVPDSEVKRIASEYLAAVYDCQAQALLQDRSYEWGLETVID